MLVERLEGTDESSSELRELVGDELGKPFKPSKIVFVEALPKTRSAKILRRAVRAVAIGEDPATCRRPRTLRRSTAFAPRWPRRSV